MKIKVYTREPENEYTESLAYSVHFALADGNDLTKLNDDYGILFAEADIGENNVICEKRLRNPRILREGDNSFSIIATKTDADGNEEGGGKVLHWTSKDLLEFEYHGLCALDISSYDECAEITPEEETKISERWLPESKPEIKFPLARGYADPVIMPRDSKYYFLATNDNLNDIGLYARVADTLDDLFTPGFKESLILDVNDDLGFIQTFWAPEFHEIGGGLYILFAVSGKEWGPQCHMMKLKAGGDIMAASDWETPVRVRRQDGSLLTEDGITLDMTYFKADGKSYLVWSYRKGIGTPLDTGSMLYIASADEHNPAVLTSEPVLLSRPLLGWENLQGTINNEGPYPLITEDTVYIAYSGGAATGYTYSIGLLSAPLGSDFLDISSWKKAPTPALKYCSLPEVYGAGHNSFFCDYDGSMMIMYHAIETLQQHGVRCTGMHKIRFDQSGRPVLGKR